EPIPNRQVIALRRIMGTSCAVRRAVGVERSPRVSRASRNNVGCRRRVRPDANIDSQKGRHLMQNQVDAQERANSVAPPTRLARRKMLLVSLTALALAAAGGLMSSARAAGPGGGDEMAGGMP